MLVSEITEQDIAEYLRLDEFEENELLPYLSSAKAFISSYTGIPLDELDNYDEFWIVCMVLVLISDMYDNRSFYADKSNVNNIVKTILDMHCRNLIM